MNDLPWQTEAMCDPCLSACGLVSCDSLAVLATAVEEQASATTYLTIDPCPAIQFSAGTKDACCVLSSTHDTYKRKMIKDVLMFYSARPWGAFFQSVDCKLYAGETFNEFTVRLRAHTISWFVPTSATTKDYSRECKCTCFLNET